MGEESSMRSRWVKKLSNSIPRWYNARMGKLPDVHMAAAYSPILGYADLVYIDDGFVNIVEFKVRNFRGAVGQLLSYSNEFAKTPEFQAYRQLPIRLLIVAPRYDIPTQELADQHGIDYEVFVG